MGLSSAEKRLMKTIDELLAQQPHDTRLRDHLEGLRRDQALPGLTWYWGPLLHARNPAVFREFLERHFCEFRFGALASVRRVAWKTHADRLEPWLSRARANRETWLSRRLLRWKFGKLPYGVDEPAFRKALAADYAAARTPAAQAIVLEEYDDTWFELDEPTATALYTHNPACASFLLKHLTRTFALIADREKRVTWRGLHDCALKAGDEAFALALYRRQAPLRDWQRDIERLAREIEDPAALNARLRVLHPEGWNLKLAPGMAALLELRGRDVMPYVREKLASVVGGWLDRKPDDLLALARRRGWWDLWAALARVTSNPSYFNRAVAELLDDRALTDRERIERLRALAGVSREWSWPGIGLARIHALEDDLAARLHERYPELVRGPFRPNVAPTWWQGGPKLLAAAQQAGDDVLVDMLASRYVTRMRYDFPGFQARFSETVKTAEELAIRYQAVRDADAARFARRAANVLTQIPSYAIERFPRLLRTNGLARLLFVRSASAFLSVPEAVRDLVEADEIHVQMLGYRVLAQDDPRARRLAAELAEIVQGALLRPLRRGTRLAAMGALANAARADLETARGVLRRARQALRLSDRHYPREELAGLIAQILALWPTLRSTREHIVIYRLEEAQR